MAFKLKIINFGKIMNVSHYFRYDDRIATNLWSSLRHYISRMENLNRKKLAYELIVIESHFAQLCEGLQVRNGKEYWIETRLF